MENFVILAFAVESAYVHQDLVIVLAVLTSDPNGLK
jgi:hypothetical protein